jgi:hypothetical protein
MTGDYHNINRVLLDFKTTSLNFTGSIIRLFPFQ